VSNIPEYFINKIKNEKPHKWMQVNQTLLMSTHPYVLYQLPDGTEVYGNSEKHLVIEPNDKSWTVNFFNPKTKEFEYLTSEEKDWVFCSSDLTRDCHYEFTEVEYTSTNGYIKFDIAQWLHKHVSKTLTLDEDFYFYGVVKLGNKEFELQRYFENYASVEGRKQLYLVFKRENDVYNVTEELKRYFAKKKMPDDIEIVYSKIQKNEMTIEDFELWVRGDQ